MNRISLIAVALLASGCSRHDAVPPEQVAYRFEQSANDQWRLILSNAPDGLTTLTSPSDPIKLEGTWIVIGVHPYCPYARVGLNHLHDIYRTARAIDGTVSIGVMPYVEPEDGDAWVSGRSTAYEGMFFVVVKNGRVDGPPPLPFVTRDAEWRQDALEQWLNESLERTPAPTRIPWFAYALLGLWLAVGLCFCYLILRPRPVVLWLPEAGAHSTWRLWLPDVIRIPILALVVLVFWPLLFLEEVAGKLRRKT